MSKITIEWLSDENNCETCGTDWAQGAIVKLDGVVIHDLQPIAACWDATDYSREDVFRVILEGFGYSIEES